MLFKYILIPVPVDALAEAGIDLESEIEVQARTGALLITNPGTEYFICDGESCPLDEDE